MEEYGNRPSIRGYTLKGDTVEHILFITCSACRSSPSNFLCFSFKSTSTFRPRDIGGGDVTRSDRP